MQFDGLSEPIVALLRRYFADMEVGANINPASRRGARSYGRMRNLKGKMHTLCLIFQDELGIATLEELECKEREILLLTKKMREGKVLSRKSDRMPLTAIGTYVKIIKAFWHWYMRAQRKEGKNINDITIDLDGRDEKPKFSYFTIDDVKMMCDWATPEYKTLMMFLFDSGIRAPTELMNVRVNDLEWDAKNNYYTLSIREETSKTFGRRIKLLLCSGILRGYIETMGLKNNDYIFTRTPQRVNQQLKRLAYRVLKIGKQNGKQHIENGISLYDFRHCSACYWLPRYKSESALKYRFGWKRSEMIHYYTELLGMKDTITDEDLYVDITKSDLEKQIQDKGEEIELLQEQMKKQDEVMTKIMKTMEALQLEKGAQTPTQS